MKQRDVASPGYRFGWFKGVYTPSVLTVFGVIMYLRFGWVLGNVGLPRTILIVLIANLITFLTALSLSALSTNMKVAGGGTYFMISRSLGLEPGAAIGLPLFLAQAIGVSFYTAGFAESLVNVFPALDPVIVGVATLVVLSILAWTSADLALKTQYFVMGAIALSLVSFFAGSSPPADVAASLGEIPTRLGFWAVFAVFFPAVTGIEAGIAMSGDLKNPAKALPLGTMAAVLTGLVVYLAIPVFLATRVNDDGLLRAHPLIMREVARVGELVVLGVWGASLSSAMGCILGAPRTLQALARDRIVPAVLGRGFGRGNDPRIATVFVFFIALTGILLGDLTAIAPVLSMFFLTAYGFLNLSAGLETIIGSPSWRPQFKVWWVWPILGFAACMMVMLMIDAGATIVATIVCVLVYIIVKRRNIRASWGDMRSGIMMMLARFALNRLAEKETDERTWKPNLLVLTGPPTQRWHLVDLARAVARENSLMTVAVVMPEGAPDERVQDAQVTLGDYLHKNGVNAFVKTVKARDPFEGGRILVNTYGFGPLVPNTILLGETRDDTHLVDYARFVLQAYAMHRNLVIACGRSDAPVTAPGGRIDVWWRGRGRNAGFMLALSHLIAGSPDWKGSRLCISTIVQNSEERAGMESHLTEFLAESRLDADYRILGSGSGQVLETVRFASADAGLVIMGLRPPEQGEEAESYSLYYREMLQGTDGMPLTILVLANEAVDFRKIFT